MGNQLQLQYKSEKRGGPREGAGRPPRGERAGVEHGRRPRFERRLPVFVTLRMAARVWNLRSRRSLRVLNRAFVAATDRFGARVVQFAILGNHIHLLLEANNTAALVRGVKGLSIRIAKKLNRLMSTRGKVIGDRYHCRLLNTPTEVKNAIHYIRHNHRKHMAEVGEYLPTSWVDPYESESPAIGIALPPPRTWLVQRYYVTTPPFREAPLSEPP
jgi:REP element-mobilizing transposase RayT